MNNQVQPAGKIISDMYRRLAFALIKHKDKLVIDVIDTTSEVILTAMAHHEDHGKLIGGGGEHYKAMTLLLKVACDRRGKVLEFQQIKPQGPKSPFHQFRPANKWDSAPLLQLVKETCSVMFCYDCDVAVEDVGNITLIRIGMHDAEPIEDDRDIGAALKKLFAAIGLANGRKVTLELARKQEAGV